MNETLYIKAEQMIRVTAPDVTLGDLGELWCSNPSVLAKSRSLRLMKMKGERTVASIVDVVRTVEENIPQVTVENLGESDFVIEYKPVRHRVKIWEWLKFAAVWLVIFFGAAFAIATFNEDVSVTKVFEAIHQGLTGQERTGFTWLEGGYAVGLSAGILVFYDHLSKRKETSDPTPMDVEMRTYEKDLYTTMIDNKARNLRAKDQ